MDYDECTKLEYIPLFFLDASFSNSGYAPLWMIDSGFLVKSRDERLALGGIFHFLGAILLADGANTPLWLIL